MSWPMHVVTWDLEMPLHHPIVAQLELSYEVMELAADAGLRLAICTHRAMTSRPADEARPRREEHLRRLPSCAA